MDQLRTKRGFVRTAITKTISTLSTLLEDPATPTGTLESYLAVLEQKYSELVAFDNDIQATLFDTDLEADMATAFDYQQKVLFAQSEVRRVIQPRPPTLPTSFAFTATPNGEPLASAPQQPPTSPSFGHPTTSPCSRIALPKLHIPTFSGERRDWQGFWDQFKASIHDNDWLPKIDKFKYLLTYLTGAAKAAIQGIRLAEANYDMAVKVLSDRFGRRDMLVDDHLDHLLSLEPVRSSSEVSKLRILHDEVTFRMNALDGLGVSPGEYGAVLRRVLLKALPSDFCILYRQRQKEALPPDNAAASPADQAELVKDLMNFIRVQIEIREESGFGETTSFPSKRHAQREFRGPEVQLPTAAALSAEVRSSYSRPCLLCNSPAHTIQECSEPLTPEEQRRRIQARNLCFRCAKGKHFANECRTARSLQCRRCSGPHLTSLCDINHITNRSSRTTLRSNNASAPREQAPESAVTQCRATSVSTSGAGLTPVLLQTGRAWAIAPAKTILIRFLLDSGSQRSFVRQDIARTLNCPVRGTERLNLFTFGKTHLPSTITCERVAITLRSQHNSNQTTIEALAVPEISAVTSPPADGAIIDIMRRRGMLPADECLGATTFQEDEISVLIGSDIYWDVATGQITRVSPRITAAETLFGWTIQGTLHPLSPGSDARTTSLFIAVNEATANDADLDMRISNLWRIDALGLQDSPEDSQDDILAYEMFERHVSKKERRYEVPLLIREPGLDDSQNNYALAKQRLLMQLRRFRERSDLLARYDDTIKAYFKESHAERVPNPDSSPKANTYYMPHHGVIRRDAVTTKLRIVFDASSHAPGQPSLNSVLFKGPKLNADLLRLLLSFRMHPIIMVADIKKAYLQIAIRPEDRDALRFLWVARLPSEQEPSPPIVQWRMTRVPFGATSSPFLLAATLHHHLRASEKRFPETAECLRQSFYVDDLVVGADNVQKAQRIYTEARTILTDAGMELRKWASNSSSLRQQFRADHLSLEDEGGDAHEMKVLGLSWERNEDSIIVSVDHVIKLISTMPTTKRTTLQGFASLYDPLGFLVPFTVRAKLIFQDLWKLKQPWDCPLPQEQLTAWNSWHSELPMLRKVRLPRQVNRPQEHPISETELHIFADASLRAYGVAIYVCTESISSHERSTYFLMSKGRIAPLKPVSLPRLELLACLLAARIYNYIKKIPCFQAARPFFWTDSQIAIHWMSQDPGRRDMYVRNRVAEIQHHTAGHTWRHCKSKENPADLLTRGITAFALLNSSLWWRGPSWLSAPMHTWKDNTACPKPVTNEETGIEATCAVINTQPQALLEVSNYSRYSRLLRVTAWVYRFISNAASQRASTVGPLNAQEIDRAERYWIKKVQRSHFPDDVAALSSNLPVPPTSRLLLLRPFIDDDGLIRVGGRLQLLPGLLSVRHPIVLPRRDAVTELLIRATHERILHSSVEHTLTELRDRFWVLKGRQAVKSALKNCLVCRRQKITPESAPAAPLPRDRITEANPFAVVGVDFCGPLYCWESKQICSKAYIAIFSCAVTRALHLELTTDMTAVSFAAAFRRFISRRGLPSTIYSDNALAFHHTARQLGKEPTSTLADFCSEHRIEWKFNVERAPWWGGWWERIIRITKCTLKRALGRSRLSFEDIVTVLCEVEANINSRPLTYLSADSEDPGPLTPSHFLLGKRATSLPQSFGAAMPQSTGVDLRRRLRHRQALTEHLWKRWRKEYLLLLRSAHEATPKASPRLRVGDVVLVHDDSLPPIMWKLARVTELLPGRDGVVRACYLKQASGSVIKRPVQKVYLLEAGGTT